MRNERPKPAEARGFALRDEVQETYKDLAKKLSKLSQKEKQTGKISPVGKIAAPYAFLVGTVAAHIDDLPIDWTDLAGKTSPRRLNDTLTVCIRYAHMKIGSDFSSFFTAEDEQSGWEILRSALNDERGKRYFQESLTKLPDPWYPERATALPYVLQHEFGSRPRPLVGIDLGAGINGTMPYLTLPECVEEDFSGKTELSRLALPLKIKLGLGVDVQNADDDLDWVRACSTDLNATPETQNIFNEKLQTLLSLRNHGPFPSLTADIRAEGTTEAIKNLLHENGIAQQTADFVLTSFMTHLAFENEEELTAFHPHIADLLAEGGLWINVGQELITDESTPNPSVRVYIKKNGKMELHGTPFRLNSRGKGIASVDLAYFATSSPRQPF